MQIINKNIIFVLATGFRLFYFKTLIESVSSKLNSLNLVANTGNRGFLFGEEMEIWKDIKGYEGYYQISNFGKVKSLKRMRRFRGGLALINERIMKPKIHSGYYRIGLCKNNKIKTFNIHRLVALSFIPNPYKKRTINHIDCNKANNNVNNLEWNTHKENIKHALKMGLRNPPRGKNHWRYNPEIHCAEKFGIEIKTPEQFYET